MIEKIKELLSKYNITDEDLDFDNGNEIDNFNIEDYSISIEIEDNDRPFYLVNLWKKRQDNGIEYIDDIEYIINEKTYKTLMFYKDNQDYIKDIIEENKVADSIKNEYRKSDLSMISLKNICDKYNMKVEDYLFIEGYSYEELRNEIYEQLYNELGYKKIDTLYMISCLKTSGVEDFDEVMKLEPILYECWLKDENNGCISSLSDMLVNVKDMVDLEKISIRQLLVLMYNDDNDYDEED